MPVHPLPDCPALLRVLLHITGPSGCGKSATLHVLASSLGFEVVEWNAPVPTLWSDYQYQVLSMAATQYSTDTTAPHAGLAHSWARFFVSISLWFKLNSNVAASPYRTANNCTMLLEYHTSTLY